jgi:hypothetical protein
MRRAPLPLACGDHSFPPIEHRHAQQLISMLGFPGVDLGADYDGYLAIEYVWIEWEHMNECDNVSETVQLRERLLAHLAQVQR